MVDVVGVEEIAGVAEGVETAGVVEVGKEVGRRWTGGGRVVPPPTGREHSIRPRMIDGAGAVSIKSAMRNQATRSGGVVDDCESTHHAPFFTRSNADVVVPLIVQSGVYYFNGYVFFFCMAAVWWVTQHHQRRHHRFDS